MTRFHGVIDNRPPGVERICDFCSAEEVTTVFPAVETELDRRGNLSLVSTGPGWCACAACSQAIETDDRKQRRVPGPWDGRRALILLARKHRLDPQELVGEGALALIRSTHEKFFAARTESP